MQHSQVQFFAGVTWTLEIADLWFVSSSTFPAPLSLSDPLDYLSGVQFLELMAGIQKMVLIVTIGTV